MFSYNGSLLMAQVAPEKSLLFSYDANGQAVSVNYNGTEYYYLRNGQNDIVSLMDESGVRVVEYIYDAWGKLISTTGTLATTLGADNPFRYRGYYYDTETGLYYLTTRCYDPEVCRFISADVYMSTGQGVLGGNMWAYCLNNPLIYEDSQGDLGVIGTLLVGAAVGAAIGAIIGGVFGGLTSLANGDGFWQGAASGAITGCVVGVATSISAGFIAGAIGGFIGGALAYYITTPNDERNFADAIGAAVDNAIWGGIGGGIANIGAPAGSSILTSAAVNVTVTMTVESLHTVVGVSAHHIRERISTESRNKKTSSRAVSKGSSDRVPVRGGLGGRSLYTAMVK